MNEHREWQKVEHEILSLWTQSETDGWDKLGYSKASASKLKAYRTKVASRIKVEHGVYHKS